ncbi:MAG: zf-HC2 domain-containing protein [Oscillospiraceae bacterium]|nr:zf-HC2 domain-containing protein [Oscillospiraceae bacterium]
MTECEKFQELVSCLTDGELTEAEKLRLDAHLTSCPACRAYRDLLADIASLEKSDPPASLVTNVMDAARRAPKPKNVTARRWVTGTVAAAACLAVIVLAALPSFTSSGAEAPMAVSAGGAAGVSMSRSAEGGAAPAASSAPEVPAAGIYYASKDNAAEAERADAPCEESAPMPSAAPAAAPEPEPETAVSDGIEETFSAEDYAAVVRLSGELPETLDAYELHELGDGALAAVVPLELVSELEPDGPDVLNADAKYADEALVIFNP